MTDNNSRNPIPINPRFYHIGLLLIMILTIGIRLSAINRTVRWDEGRNLQQYAQRPISEFMFDFSDTNNQFLNTLMMHIQYRLLDDDQNWKLRVHVFLIGLLVPIATFYAGKALYDPDVGLMASALSSVMYLMIEFSINARGYIIITVIYIIMTILIQHMKTQTNRRGWIAIGLLSALGFYVSPIFLYSMGILGLWMVLAIHFENEGQHRRQVFRYFFGAMILGASLTILFYAPLIIQTVGVSSSAETSWVIRYSQPKGNVDFFTVRLPYSMRAIFDISHLGMPIPIIVLSLVGFLIAVIFHTKLSKDRVPLIIPTIIWSFAQIVVLQTYVLERTYTFLMPFYAIFIAAGLIALVRLVVGYRLSRFLVAVILSLIMVGSITYQLLSEQILIRATVTGSMPYGEQVIARLPDLVEPGAIIMTEDRFIGVLTYYMQRDNIDLQLAPMNPEDATVFDGWELGEYRYMIGYTGMDFFTVLLRYYDLELPDQNFVFEPVADIYDNYSLFKIKRTAPEIKVLTDASDFNTYWYVGQDDVSYTLNDDNALSFDIHGDSWKIIRFRHGDAWQDYRLSLRLKITAVSDEFEEVFIRFRDTGNSTYSFVLNVDPADNENIGLRYDLDSSFFRYFSVGSYPMELDRWYDISIDINGDTFTAFIDNEQVLEGTNNILRKGTISFLASPETTAQISDMRLD